MENNAKTLFVFEGARTEDKFVEKLENNFLGNKHAIKCVYDAEIYQLYNIIKGEGKFSLDIVSSENSLTFLRIFSLISSIILF